MKKLLIATSIFLLHGVCINQSYAQVLTNQQQRQKNIEADNVLLNAFATGDVSKLDTVIAADFLIHADTDKVGLDSLKAMINISLNGLVVM